MTVVDGEGVEGGGEVGHRGREDGGYEQPGDAVRHLLDDERVGKM